MDLLAAMEASDIRLDEIEAFCEIARASLGDIARDAAGFFQFCGTGAQSVPILVFIRRASGLASERLSHCAQILAQPRYRIESSREMRKQLRKTVSHFVSQHVDYRNRLLHFSKLSEDAIQSLTTELNRADQLQGQQSYNRGLQKNNLNRIAGLLKNLDQAIGQTSKLERQTGLSAKLVDAQLRPLVKQVHRSADRAQQFINSMFKEMKFAVNGASSSFLAALEEDGLKMTDCLQLSLPKTPQYISAFAAFSTQLQSLSKKLLARIDRFSKDVSDYRSLPGDWFCTRIKVYIGRLCQSLVSISYQLLKLQDVYHSERRIPSDPRQLNYTLRKILHSCLTSLKMGCDGLDASFSDQPGQQVGLNWDTLRLDPLPAISAQSLMPARQQLAARAKQYQNFVARWQWQPSGDQQVFGCSINDGILLRGELAICSDRLVFSSSFNGQHLFGSSQYVIPAVEILQCEMTWLFLIPNAIKLSTTRGSLYFSFISGRSAVCSLIQALIDQPQLASSTSLAAPTRQYFSPQQLQQLSKAQGPRLPVVEGSKRIVNFTFKDTSLPYFFDLFLTDNPNPDSPLRSVYEKLNFFNHKISDFGVSSFREALLSGHRTFNRQISANVRMKKLPFLPDVIQSFEKHQLCLQSTNRVVLRSIILTPEVPMAQTLVCTLFTIYEQQGPNLHCEGWLHMHLGQSSFFSSLIFSESEKNIGNTLNVTNQHYSRIYRAHMAQLLNEDNQDCPSENSCTFLGDLPDAEQNQPGSSRVKMAVGFVVCLAAAIAYQVITN